MLVKVSEYTSFLFNTYCSLIGVPSLSVAVIFVIDTESQ